MDSEKREDMSISDETHTLKNRPRCGHRRCAMRLASRTDLSASMKDSSKNRFCAGCLQRLQICEEYTKTDF